METIRFVLGTLFLAAGLVMFVIEIIGNYRFGYVLNRMQAAAIGDSFGLALCLLGAIFYFGFSMASLKLVFIEVFLWFSSPVCSHLVAKLEQETNERIDAECPQAELSELFPKSAEEEAAP